MRIDKAAELRAYELAWPRRVIKRALRRLHRASSAARSTAWYAVHAYIATVTTDLQRLNTWVYGRALAADSVARPRVFNEEYPPNLAAQKAYDKLARAEWRTATLTVPSVPLGDARMVGLVEPGSLEIYHAN